MSSNTKSTMSKRAIRLRSQNRKRKNLQSRRSTPSTAEVFAAVDAAKAEEK